MNNLFSACCTGLLLVATGCVLCASRARAAEPSDLCFVSASDKAYAYEGRIDLRKASDPVLIWQGSQVRVAFTGRLDSLVFGPRHGSCFFDVRIDGKASVIELKAGNEPVIVPNPLATTEGVHELVLFKRSEADAGYATFQGLRLAANGKVSAPARIEHPLRIQFFGDSITAGACNEDGAVDQWETRATHNAAFSYAALTAAALQADYRNISVSGMGIVTGYVPKQAGQIWDRLYPEIGSPKADEGTWKPDIVFVNFGENDDSFTRNQGVPFPAGFVEGYVAMVREMRRAYPLAEFVILRGGMSGGANSEPLRHAWEAVVSQLEAQDAHIHHYVFSHWSVLHPRVADDRAMADELAAWVKAQPFASRKP